MPDPTPITKERILPIIFAVIDEINETQAEDQKLEKSADTHLFDRKGKLDSIGLVNLIVSLEQGIMDEFGVGVTLADEKALSRENSPFRTVSSLADYVLEKLTNANN